MTNEVGAIIWRDLTVPNAEQVRDFYARVVGWQAEPIEMGDYADFNMLIPGTDQSAAGICHARGFNADQPAQWIMYIKGAHLDQSIRDCQALGGRILVGPKSITETQRFVVIQDPAGATVALMD